MERTIDLNIKLDKEKSTEKVDGAAWEVSAPLKLA